jgi:NAD(P)-dependent dehydrogenase (short-subunit alcohol dehydrogenase family)
MANLSRCDLHEEKRQMQLDLTGRVALVTGAGSGIGEAAAKKLAAAGARVAALGRSEDELRDVVKHIRSRRCEAMSVIADISDAAAMQKAYAQVEKEWGRLDIVFANAGINGVWSPIEELTPEEWNQTIAINLTGTFYTIKYAAPLLKRQGGSVIVTASVNGTRIFSNTGATAYSTSKAGQVAMTKMLALELAPHKVRVNVICPGAIETNIDQNTERRNLEEVQIPVEFPESNQPLTGGEPGRSEEVGDLVLFLASDMSSHITGTEIWIDGAESLIKG